jgi:hypothetical protein
LQRVKTWELVCSAWLAADIISKAAILVDANAVKQRDNEVSNVVTVRTLRVCVEEEHRVALVTDLLSCLKCGR